MNKKPETCVLCKTTKDLEDTPILILVDGFEIYQANLLLCESCQCEIEDSLEIAMEMILGG
jgi:hypothetical protein